MPSSAVAFDIPDGFDIAESDDKNVPPVGKERFRGGDTFLWIVINVCRERKFL